MKRLLMLCLLASLASVCWGQVVSTFCDGAPVRGVCYESSITTTALGTAYAETEIVGLCFPNGATPQASAYAFASCGPSMAFSTGGALNSRVQAQSSLSGVINDGPGNYWEDCDYSSDGDGGASGDCIAPYFLLCLILGGFCD